MNGTAGVGLVYRKSNDSKLFGFVDADWAGNNVDRKSYTGFAFKIGHSVVSWESRKQATTALSLTEAEYIGLSEAAKEMLHLSSLMNELGWRSAPVPI